MTRKGKRRKCGAAQQVAGRLLRCTKTERLIRELELIAQGAVRHQDPIEEQLRKCPEAFQAGELIGKMFDVVKYGNDESRDERYLPPAGAVMPPLV